MLGQIRTVVFSSLQGYQRALNLQKTLVEIKKNPCHQLQEHTLLLLQHKPTFTAGRRIVGFTDQEKNRFRLLGADYFETLRGGQVTFHGPGQLVGYPILSLKELKISPKCYVAKLQKLLISTCKQYGIQAQVNEHTGVWVGERKIGAIGIQISRGITMHGFSLNVSTDLDWFKHIIPCGLPEAKTTTFHKELMQTSPSVEEVSHCLAQEFSNEFGLQLHFIEENKLYEDISRLYPKEKYEKLEIAQTK